MRYWLVMPAAGVGRRFGDAIPKQYADLHGRTVIEWSLAPFMYDSRCLGIVVVLGAEDGYWKSVADRLPDITGASKAEATLAAALAEATRVAERVAAKTASSEPGPFAGAEPRSTLEPGHSSHQPAAVTLPKVITTVGGSERSHSVRNGLAALARRAGPDDWVLVHDAARPCVSRQDVDRLLEKAHSHPVGGLLASPAADTLKRAGITRDVVETVDRSGLWRALTPQMFRYAPLCAALDAALGQGRSPTDESQAMEWTGLHPIVVEGSTTNIKITSADDLVIALALLSAHRGRQETEVSTT